jgi:hypothetical protein
MTDRRRSQPWHRVWRATVGCLCPVLRRLRARKAWDWWMAKGVIPRWQLLLVYVFVVAAGSVGVARVETIAEDASDLGRENANRIKETEESRDALCVLRADLERRVATSRDFLEENPAGIPGIPARTIRDGIRNQERTIEALSGLSCRG